MRIGSRSAIQLADQAAASLNNLVVTIVVARAVGVEGLGEFNLPFAVYIAALGLQRAALVEPVMAGDARKPYPGVVVISAALGFAIVIVGSTAAFVRQDSGLAVWAGAIAVMLLFDVCRYIAIHSGANYISLVMDSIWLLGTTSMIFALPDSLPNIVLVWGLFALAGLVIFIAWYVTKVRISIDGSSIANFLAAARGISLGSVGESAIYQFGWQLPLASALAVIGLAESAEYRAALTILAPMGVVISAWTVLSYGKQRRRLQKWEPYRLASVTVSLSLVYLSVCLVSLPLINRILFQTSDFLPWPILLAVGIQFPLIACSSQFGVYLKICRSSRQILHSRMWSSVLVLAFFATGIVTSSVWLVVLALPAGMALFAIKLMAAQYEVSRIAGRQGDKRVVAS